MSNAIVNKCLNNISFCFFDILQTLTASQGVSILFLFFLLSSTALIYEEVS